MEIILGLVVGTAIGLYLLSVLDTFSETDKRLTKLERKRK